MHHYVKGRKRNATHQKSESIPLKTLHNNHEDHYFKGNSGRNARLGQDVASGTRLVDDFLRGVTHNILCVPVNREPIMKLLQIMTKIDDA